MASVYAGAAATALALISAKGGQMRLRRVTTTLDPVTQAATETTDASVFRAVGLPPGKSAEYHLGSLQGRNIIELHIAQLGQAPEANLYAALGYVDADYIADIIGVDLVPQPGDIVTWTGADWRVIWVNALNPAGDLAVYTKAYAER